MRDNSRGPGRGRQTDKKSMRVEMKCADQTRIANGYKSYPMLAPIVGQCFLPTHTWRKSNCTNDLNAATFNCQVRNTTVLALPRRTPSYQEVTNGYRCRPRSIPRRTRRARFSWASFVALFAVRSADQLRRWRYSSADTFSRIEYSRAYHRQRRWRGLGARAQSNSCAPKPGRARRAASIANGYRAHWNKETACSGDNGRSLLSRTNVLR